ncbi:hypothetical protein E2C01_069401 [Portunus trituberculatus]|uniref:Uncharacterized protein n=1 Tax=Portunus trituberculatus TaxID=210409 RepID=A0A5B7I234_PORTR|nr:hypothetical protein [Portunus trituberculatus]
MAEGDSHCVVRHVTAKFDFKSPSVHAVVRGHPTAKSEFLQLLVKVVFLEPSGSTSSRDPSAWLSFSLRFLLPTTEPSAPFNSVFSLSTRLVRCRPGAGLSSHRFSSRCVTLLPATDTSLVVLTPAGTRDRALEGVDTSSSRDEDCREWRRIMSSISRWDFSTISLKDDQ